MAGLRGRPVPVCRRTGGLVWRVGWSEDFKPRGERVSASGGKEREAPGRPEEGKGKTRP